MDDYADHDLLQTIVTNHAEKYQLTVRQYLRLRAHMHACKECSDAVDRLIQAHPERQFHKGEAN